jgi:ribosomal protein S6
MEIFYKKRMRAYEMPIIFTVIVKENECLENLEKLKENKWIDDVVSINSIGERQLATPIRDISKNKHNRGRYFLVKFKLLAENVKKLRDEIKFEESILRFRLLRSD